jgi:hypothetical protein
METKHTPGNWTIGKSDSVVVSDKIPDDYLLNGGHDDIEYYGGFCICESIAKKADAKLIAAAPDMLDMLMTIENDINQVPEWLWNKIQDVIKKATE